MPLGAIAYTANSFKVDIDNSQVRIMSAKKWLELS